MLLPQCFPSKKGTSVKLDAKTVAALKLGDKSDQIFFDDQLPGFGFRLRRGAGDKINKSWIVQYRRAGGTRRVLIGNANIISAEAARAAAKKILALVELGGDPQADRVDRHSKDQLTMRSVVVQYLDGKKVRPRTLVEATRYLSTGAYFKPLHGMPVDAVKRKDIASCLISITRKNGSITAARARTALSTFFTWSMQMGYIEANPIIGCVEPEDSKGRERVLSDDELAAVWRGSSDGEYGRIIRLLILTGARRAEIGGLRWSELDHDAGTWTLPAERSKNKHAHSLPLPQAAWAIIKAVPRLAHRDQLFGVSAAEGFSDWGHGKIALDDRLLGKMSEPWTIHDIRRSAATKMADLGVQPHIIEQILNHRGGHKRGVAGVYNRSGYAFEVRAALALWADYLRTLAEGGERKIVPLRA